MLIYVRIWPNRPAFAPFRPSATSRSSLSARSRRDVSRSGTAFKHTKHSPREAVFTVLGAEAPSGASSFVPARYHFAEILRACSSQLNYAIHRSWWNRIASGLRACGQIGELLGWARSSLDFPDVQYGGVIIHGGKDKSLVQRT